MAYVASTPPHADFVSRGLGLAGVLAPLVYGGTVILGGGLTAGYSHVGNAISELIQAGAPHRETLERLFLIYNLLALLFASGLFRLFARETPILAIGSILLAVTAILGLVMKNFPMDPVGTPATALGTGHLILAGLMSLTTIGAVAGFAVGFRRLRAWAGWSTYSLVSVIAIAASGGVAAMAAAQGWDTMGLWERVTIGAMLQWMFAVGVRLSLRGD